jgi:hypothetical protein
MRRQSFEIAGYKHGGNPIPAVTRIGKVVLTGGISGIDIIPASCRPLLKINARTCSFWREKS